MDLTWMAWTRPTAIFWGVIGLLLCGMALWEWRRPGGGPRRGALGLRTTRGDRLFISLLGSAFINLLWLALVGPNLWPALGLCVFFALAVFRWV